jgi:hypothetical protein
MIEIRLEVLFSNFEQNGSSNSTKNAWKISGSNSCRASCRWKTLKIPVLRQDNATSIYLVISPDCEEPPTVSIPIPPDTAEARFSNICIFVRFVSMVSISRKLRDNELPGNFCSLPSLNNIKTFSIFPVIILHQL